MARRQTSPLEDLAETAAILPWWVGCVLAVVSFLIFHAYANAEILKPEGAGQMGVFVVESLFANFARVLQYLVPGAFCIGSIVSLFNGARRKTLFKDPGTLFNCLNRDLPPVSRALGYSGRTKPTLCIKRNNPQKTTVSTLVDPFLILKIALLTG
jgi:hypothetical protein